MAAAYSSGQYRAKGRDGLYKVIPIQPNPRGGGEHPYPFSERVGVQQLAAALRQTNKSKIYITKAFMCIQ